MRASFTVVNPWRWASSSFDPETDLSFGHDAGWCRRRWFQLRDGW